MAPFYPDTLVLHDFPNNGNSPYNCYRLSINPKDNASFLVLKVQTDVPVWDQWVQVLYSWENTKNSGLIVGWMPYTEFNRAVLVEWDKWEEEKKQPNNPK